VYEASQVWMGPLLAPATVGDANILVGDPKQLPPLLHEDPEQMEPEVREQVDTVIFTGTASARARSLSNASSPDMRTAGSVRAWP